VVPGEGLPFITLLKPEQNEAERTTEAAAPSVVALLTVRRGQGFTNPLREIHTGL